MKNNINIHKKLIDLGYGDIQNRIFDFELEYDVFKWLKDNHNIEIFINKTKGGGEYMKGFSYTIITPNSSSQRYGFRFRKHAFKNALKESLKEI